MTRDERIIANALRRLQVTCIRCKRPFQPSDGRQMRCTNCFGKYYPLARKEASEAH